MSNLSEDAKAIVASNLTLAFFIREHTRYSTNKNLDGSDLQEDSQENVLGFFNEFKQILDK